ncbi:MAG: YbaN family protein [Oceanospirillum sp.]|nr:YbaN family protein [Oceanospirillum sp.]
MGRFRKPLYMAAGFLALLLGAIGVVLPLLPTTPFIILAAFFFSKGSRKVHRWLLNQKTFGPMIRAWEHDRVIPFKAKLLSTTMMLTMVSYPLLFRPFSLWLKVLVVFTVFFALWYVWRHRSEPMEVAVERSWNQLSSAAPVTSSQAQPVIRPQGKATATKERPSESSRATAQVRKTLSQGRKKPVPLGWKPAHVVLMSAADQPLHP